VTTSQVGLALLLHHAPNVLLIPGAADPAHLAVGEITFGADTLATLDAVRSRPSNVPIGEAPSRLDG
jgi:hypothetical protein